MKINNEPIYSCEEHIDIAIDDFLVENETFPVMGEVCSVNCSYCEKTAVYVLHLLNKNII